MTAMLFTGNDGNQPRGASYDEMSLPTEMGSGGYATMGGGYISITSHATLTVDGTVSAKYENSPIKQSY